MTRSPNAHDPFPSVQSLFEPAPGIAYLDAATYGLPPTPSVNALTHALRRWQTGEAEWVGEWDRKGESCRSHFATLIGGTAKDVALVPTASVGVGLVAASLPVGVEVIVPDDEFTSVLFPILVAEEQRRIHLRRLPFGELAAGIGPETHLVAFSLTRSQDGETASLDNIVTAARHHGAQLLVDATHAIPFVPIQPWLSDIDIWSVTDTSICSAREGWRFSMFEKITGTISSPGLPTGAPVIRPTREATAAASMTWPRMPGVSMSRWPGMRGLGQSHHWPCWSIGRRRECWRT